MNILIKKEISEYYNNFVGMYNDLLSINRDMFNDNDRIIIESFGNTTQSIWKHFRSIVEYLDIPTFFIEIYTNDNKVDDFVNKGFSEKITVKFDNQEKINNAVNDKFDYSDLTCINPFINIEVGNSGNYSPCCVFKGNLENYNANYHGFFDVKKSKDLETVKQSLLNGQWPDGCSACKQLEENGKISKRIRDNWLYRKHFFDTEWKSTDQNFISLDIKLGNACNLSCRICNQNASSSWYKEIKNNLSAWNLTEPPVVKLVNWPYNLDGIFWNSFKQIANDIRHLQFVGGEPLMNKQHIAILKFLVDNSYSRNISLHYNTNGTIWPADAQFDLFKQFQKVGISLSIDNLGDRFEYERYGDRWENVKENIDKFKKLNKTHYTVDVFTTVSIFNVLDLPKIYNYFHSEDIPISFNLLEYPEEFSIKNIPVEDRKNVVDIILSENKNINEYEFVINILNDKTNYLDLNRKFHQHVSIVDKIRNQKFSDYYPVMAEIMNKTQTDLKIANAV